FGGMPLLLLLLSAACSGGSSAPSPTAISATSVPSASGSPPLSNSPSVTASSRTPVISVYREPWVVELKSGERCTFSGGATTSTTLYGVSARANYACDKSNEWVYGRLQVWGGGWFAAVGPWNDPGQFPGGPPIHNEA